MHQFLVSLELLESDGFGPVGAALAHGHSSGEDLAASGLCFSR
jgi:hypothetical protein